MTDPDRDARVSAHYRALGREEPPAALDAEILAAARRPRARWAVPVSVAAVVVLAVGVTLRLQLEERSGAEQVALSPRVMQAPAPAPEAAPPPRRDAAPAPAAVAPMAREGQAQEPPAGARKREALAEASADRAEPAGRASVSMAVGKITRTPETPEQWLERIAQLREAGKGREADESLAAFRKRYPDYKLSDAMRARVAPR